MNAVTVKKSVTNDDLLEIMQNLMQMTHEGFGRLESRMNGFESRMENIEDRLIAIENKLRDHDMQLAELRSIAEQLLNERTAYLNDINDVLNRITELERRQPNVNEQEIRELQLLLQSVVEWAVITAKAVNVPLKFSPK